MFAVIRVKENEKNIFAKLKNFLHPVLPELIRIEVTNSTPFYYLEIFENQCGSQFENIPLLLRGCARNLVVCDNYKLPESKYVGIFRPSKLPQIALINSSIEMLKANSYDKSHFSLAFIDEMGLFREFVFKYIGLASTVIVLTNYPDKYENIAKELFDEWGVSLVITPSYTLIEECNIIISPTDTGIEDYSRTIIFKDKLGRKVYKGENVDLPQEYLKLKPEGVDNLTFASALYELSAVKCFSEIKYKDIVLKKIV